MFCGSWQQLICNKKRTSTSNITHSRTEGGKNSEGGETIKEKNKHLPVGSETQQGSARDKRQEHRKLTRQVQHQMEQIRRKKDYNATINREQSRGTKYHWRHRATKKNAMESSKTIVQNTSHHKSRSINGVLFGSRWDREKIPNSRR